MGITCSNCGQYHNNSDVRLSLSRGKPVCLYCLGIKTRKDELSLQVQPKFHEETESYQCAACFYNFSRRKSTEVSKCPYCSREGTVLPKKTADMILVEAISPLYCE